VHEAYGHLTAYRTAVDHIQIVTCCGCSSVLKRDCSRWVGFHDDFVYGEIDVVRVDAFAFSIEARPARPAAIDDEVNGAYAMLHALLRL
jgi:hypothetical protein